MDANSQLTGQFGRLQEIVSFAIQKEQEAVDFYTSVAARMKPESIAAELRKIASMEVQHRERLEKLDVAAFTAKPPSKVTNLKIADYLVAPEPSLALTWQDVLNIAMHRELAAMKLYGDLARLTENSGARALFEGLATEESKHKLFFEQVWDDEVLIEN